MAALENGNEARTETNRRRLGYLQSPVAVFPSIHAGNQNLRPVESH